MSSRHRTRFCRKQNSCTLEGCKGTFHKTLLHLHNSSPKNESSSSEPAAVLSTCASSIFSSEPLSKAVYLCIVPVKVQYQDQEVLTYAFLNQGSTHTFCDKRLVEALNIPARSDEIHVQTLTSTRACSGLRCSLKVSLDNDKECTLANVFSLDDIPVKPNLIPARCDLEGTSHLKEITFRQIENATVTILIGADTPEMFCVRSVLTGQPIAIETPLGWSLLGPSLSTSVATNCFVGHANVKDEVLHRKIQSLWETDFQPETSMFEAYTLREDRKTCELFQSSITQISGHYQLPLPWKPGLKKLPDNLLLAQRRLRSLKRKLTRDKNLHSKYTDTINTYVEKNYAKPVTSEELVDQNIVWYLPHHPVYHPHKPDKLRIIFDCAAKHEGTSLNSVLMSGPDMMKSIVGVLIRFRKESVALTGDIEAMFHQVRVHPKDRDAFRFLWCPNGNLEKDPVPYQMQVHIFGATSSPASAGFCIKQTALDYDKHYDQFIPKIVRENFYVDDCLVSVDSTSKAITVVRQLTSLLQQGGFRITKWLTNSEAVLNEIPEVERSKNLQRHNLECTSSDRVLGVEWNYKTDEFDVTVKPSKLSPLTRRGILSTVCYAFCLIHSGLFLRLF